MSSSSVQFYGLDAVLQAYTNNEVPRFALFAGKTMLLKYDGWSGDEYVKPTMDEGLQLLNNYLTSMYQGTTAIYTLKVFEDLEAKKKIAPSTEYTTAFNFKLGESQMGMIPSANGRQPYGVMAELQKTNERIDKVMELLEDDGEDDNEPEKKSFIATITGGLIADNNEVKELIDLCKSIFPSMQGQQQNPTAPATMGNVATQKVSDISSEDDTGSDKANRIKRAVETLEQLDPNFVNNLEILAKVAKRDPQQFKQFLAILKTLE